MKLRRLYLLLAFVGAVVPYYFFFMYGVEDGFGPAGLLRAMASDALTLAFFSDVAISSVAFWPFLYREAQRHQIAYWWVLIVVNVVVGLSCALPLFLYLRRKKRDEMKRSYAYGAQPKA